MSLSGLIRIAMVETGTLLFRDVNAKSGVIGSAAIGFNEIANTLRMNYTIAWINDPENLMGVPNATGHYNGLLGAVQRNEADYVPYAFTSELPFSDSLFVGPAERTVEAALASKVLVKFKKADLIQSMLCVTPSVVACIVLSILTYALLLRKFECPGSRTFTARFQKNSLMTWRLFRLIIAQADYSPLIRLSQLLIAVFAASFMMFMFNWENTMSASIVSPDLRLIIYDLDDVIANRSIKVNMVEGTPMFKRFKEAQRGSKAAELFSRVNLADSKLHDFKDKPEVLLNFLKEFKNRDRVLIMTYEVVNYMVESACFSLPDQTDTQIIKEKMFSYNVASVYGGHLSAQSRSVLEMKNYLMIESGIADYNYKRYLASVKASAEENGLEPLKKNCIIDHLEEYVSGLLKEHELDKLSNLALGGLWLIFWAGLGFSALMLISELINSALKPKRTLSGTSRWATRPAARKAKTAHRSVSTLIPSSRFATLTNQLFIIKSTQPAH